jgi:small-conductance mechanosensitive channel
MIAPGLCLAFTIPFMDLTGRPAAFLTQGVKLWLIAAFSWFTIRTIAMAREMILSRFDVNVSDNLEARRVSTQIKVLERVLVTIVVTLTVALMLMTFQTVRQVGVSILASAGLIGLVIGFAAQKSLAAILAGLQIAITQPVRLGDAVLVENEWGWIEEITLTFVVVKLWDQRRLIVPITHFLDKPFQNWTRTSAELIGSVFIYADYSLPVPEVRSELQRVVRGTDLWDGRVCNLQVTNVTQQGVELRALASAADSSQTWDLRCYVREQMLDFIKGRFPESLPRTRIKLSGNGQAPEPAGIEI